jgi:hypothetical protein
VATEPKDFWDKAGVLLHPVGGLLTALAVAVVGMKGSQVLDRRQAAETNARLYSELMSRREESESNLRKDMFAEILKPLLNPSAGDLDARVLQLELLAYNFHDSLNLKPMFIDLQRRLVASNDPARGAYLDRVTRVAREITAKQIFSLEGHGDSFRRSVDLEEFDRTGRFGVALEAETVDVAGTRCQVGLRILDVDRRLQQLRLRLEVRPAEDTPGQADTRAIFDVGFFDLPLIDNTRLANGLLCAVTLSAFTKESADLTTVCFPGEYASLKDRPYYDEVIRKLQTSADEERAAEPESPAR